MNTARILRRTAAVLVAVSMAALATLCSLDDKHPAPSDDLSALRRVVAIPDAVTSARWEIFGTPEYTRGVPGPTDYMTLVAELALADDSPFEADDPARWPSYVVPEAPRSWLLPAFRERLERSRNAYLDLGGGHACRPVRSRMRESGRIVPGFACRASGKTLLYLKLQTPRA